ncbi:PssD/Cps14F family polysaccharide biosynthesis glycosyltransferase [Candidatus Nitrospira salsa]|nr:MAG: capsular polysaccharide biosynthesis protein [Nitrospirales bacterium]
MKVCIVSSCGGHLTEVRALQSVYQVYDHFYVLNDKVSLPDDMEGKTYFIMHSERDWKFFWNLWEAWRILRLERPRVLLSTGAGPIVPFSIIGKALRIPIIFVETFTRVSYPSLTGRIMYLLADRFFYQWKSLAQFFPKGVYCGPLV